MRKITSIILLFIAVNIIAQQPETDYIKMKELDIITVTAERFPIKEKEVPRFITLVTAKELERTGANNVIDALKRIGGLSYKSFLPLGITQGGMNSEVGIRGMTGGEMVLINGVNVQAASSRAYDLNLLSLEQVERIEVVKGASSTIYGSNAMSGVINIVTKSSEGKPQVTLGVEGGNLEYLKAKASARYEGLGISFDYQKLGKIDKVSYHNTKKYTYRTSPAKQYNWSLNYMPIKNLYIDYLGGYNTINYEKKYDNPEKKLIGREQIQNKSFANIRYENKNMRAKVFLNYSLLKRDEYTNQNKPDSKNKTYNYGSEFDYRFNLNEFFINSGVNATYRAANYNQKYKHKYDIHYALFLQIKKEIFEKLNLTVGLREQFVNGGSQDKDYDIFLPSAGLTYKLTNQTNLFASFGKAFRTPTFNNLYYKSDFVEGNDALIPEKGYTYETGVKYDDREFSARISGFYMDYKDKIELDRSTAVSKYVNIGEYKSQGVEWNFALTAYNLIKLPLVITTSGFYADPIAKFDENKPDETQMGPKIQFSFGVKYLTHKMMCELNSVLTTERERNLSNYHTLNFFSSYKIWKGKITFIVDNILDRENQTAGNQTPTAKNRYAYFDMGRQFKIGYQFTL